jgi:hypothetical protein
MEATMEAETYVEPAGRQPEAWPSIAEASSELLALELEKEAAVPEHDEPAPVRRGPPGGPSADAA